MHLACCVVTAGITLAVGAAAGRAQDAQEKPMIRCEVVDAQSGKPLPARVYVRSADGKWFFARSASAEGSAVAYRKQRFATSVEMHTTVSAHPFVVDVPAGRYTVTVERGKEYLPAERAVEVTRAPARVRIALRRWIDMAAAGWYSGDTHVHRSIEELGNLLLAEDLNVGLPLTYWVTTAYTPPAKGNKGAAKRPPAECIHVDATHVIYPVNTEYEIFSTAGKRHTLGAVMIIGHKAPFTAGVPPVKPVAEQARREGALLDLDKHSWPWSLMVAAVMKVDLFELANNHVWRTEFGFRGWTIETAPAYMKLQRDERGLTEWGWIDFGFQTYYALLNCGFRMRPSAGTASGVHPVPLGFGRVYVHVPGDFTFEKWMKALGAGRSFVTTGPMLTVKVGGRPPGAAIGKKADEDLSCRVTGLACGAVPLRPIEIVVNGRVVERIDPANRRTDRGGCESPIETSVKLTGSSWIAVRAFEDRPDGRVRFAHSSPVHVEVPGRPLRPRREEVDYLLGRVSQELQRNRPVLRPEGLEEYAEALRIYGEIARHAR
ncbi:MAG: CehA/McbA family metallohydrolase [Phycisphaerae bacterium]